MTKKKYPRYNEKDDARVKVPKSEYETIRHLYNSDRQNTLKVLATLYGVSDVTIYYILHPDKRPKTESRPYDERTKDNQKRARKKKQLLMADEMTTYNRERRKRQS